MVVRNFLYNLAAQVIIKLVSFGFIIFVVRVLGSTEFGKYSTVTAFVGVLMVLADLGIGSYISREIARDESQTEFLLGNMIALRLTLAVGFMAFSTTLGWLIGYNSDLVLGIFMCSSAQLLFAFQSSMDSALLGSQRLGASALANLLNQFILVGSGVVLLLWGFGFLGLIVASLVGVTAACLLNVWNMHRRGKRVRILFAFSYWPRFLKRSLPFGLNQLAISFSYKLDSLMLGWFGGLAVVGMYNAAYNLIFTLTTLSTSINLALFPYMSHQFVIHPEETRRNFGRYMKYLFILSVPMAVIGTVLGERLAQFLFSKTYTQSGLALQILVWVLPFMFLNELLGYIAITIGQERRMAKLRMINALTNLGLNLPVIPIFGLVGASITTVLTDVVGLAQFYWWFKDKKIFPQGVGWLVRPGLAAFCAGLLALALNDWPVLLAGALALVVYFCLILISGAIEPAELNLVISSFKRSKFSNENIGNKPSSSPQI